MDQQQTTNNPQPAPAKIRDVLGGDDGKEIPVAEALGDSLENSRLTTHDSQQETPKTVQPIQLADEPVSPTLEADLTPKTPPQTTGAPNVAPKIPEGFVPIPEKAPTNNPIVVPVINTEPTPAPVVTIPKPEPMEPAPQPQSVAEPKPAPAPISIPIPTQVNETPKARPAIRTLQSDIAGSVRDNNMSLARMAIARQEKTSAINYVADTNKSIWQRINPWAIGAVIFIVAGVAVVAGAFLFVARTNIPLPFIPAAPLAPTLIAVESRETLNVTQSTRTDFIRNVDAFTESGYLSPVRIEALIIEETALATSTEAKPITLERFLGLLNTRAPGRFVRSAGPVITFGRVGDTPFLLTTIESYETAFAGLLEWEPFMADDLVVITKQQTTDDPSAEADEQQTTEAQEDIATTTTSSSVVGSLSSVDDQTATSSVAGRLLSVTAPPPIWKDIIVRNKDVRALIDHEGTILLLYAFPKDGHLVFTHSREALTTIVDTLNSPVFGR